MLIQHLLVFSGITIYAIFAYRNNNFLLKNKKKFLFLLFLSPILCEIFQIFIPLRFFSIDDIIFGWIGILISYVPYKIFREFKPKANIKELNEKCQLSRR